MRAKVVFVLILFIAIFLMSNSAALFALRVPNTRFIGYLEGAPVKCLILVYKAGKLIAWGWGPFETFIADPVYHLAEAWFLNETTGLIYGGHVFFVGGGEQLHAYQITLSLLTLGSQKREEIKQMLRDPDGFLKSKIYEVKEIPSVKDPPLNRAPTEESIRELGENVEEGVEVFDVSRVLLIMFCLLMVFVCIRK